MSEDDMGDDGDLDRAERIRSSRRGRSDQSRRQPTPSEQSPQWEQMSQAKQTPQTEQTSQTPVTDRRHATFYLAEDLHKSLDRGGKRVSLDYEMEFDAELGKNRYLRPLILYLGLERLEEMSPEEIRNALNETDVLDDAPE